MSAELSAIVNDRSIVEGAADPGVFLVEACERAKVWLREALDHGEIEQIVELKSQAEAIRVYAMSKQLGKDAQLSAAEIVRRAERGIGIAIRRGQEAGEIRGGAGRPASDEILPGGKNSPNLYAGSSGRSQSEIYAMTDGVSEEEFEEILDEAKAEEDLSRSNVVRKAKAAKRGTVPSPERPRRRKPHNDILMHSVNQLMGTIDRLDLEIDNGLDDSVTPELAGRWADDLTKVIRPLTRLRIQLKEKASG